MTSKVVGSNPTEGAIHLDRTDVFCYGGEMPRLADVTDANLLTDQQYELIRHGWRCPRCNRFMVERKRRRDNSLFFGCVAFPNCQGTRETDGFSQEEEEARIGVPPQGYPDLADFPFTPKDYGYNGDAG